MSEDISLSKTIEALGLSIEQVRLLHKQGLLHVTRSTAHEPYFLATDVARLKSRRNNSLSQKAAEVGSQIQSDMSRSITVARKGLLGLGALLGSYAVLIIALTGLFMLLPVQTANWLGLTKNQATIALGEGTNTMSVIAAETGLAGGVKNQSSPPSTLQKLFQPPGKAALGLVRLFSPGAYSAVSRVSILDPNDILKLGDSGSVRPLRPLSIPESSLLEIGSSELITNLNTQYLQGKVPGTNVGDIAIVGEAPPVLLPNLGITPSTNTITTINVPTAVAGLTIANFASPNISQWLNDAGFITSASTDTLTNKTISGLNNVLSNIANSSLTNPSLGLAGDSGLGGVALGGALSVVGSGAVTTSVSGSTITINSPAFGTVSFADVTSGTNTAAAMVIGSGASLDFSGTGTVNASTLGGLTFANPGSIGSLTPSSANFTTLTTTGASTASGNIITPFGTDYSTTGTQNDVNLGTGALFRYTGAGTATFTGLAGGVGGRQLRITNASAFNLTISHQNSGSLAANRILSELGVDVVLSANASIELLYDSSIARWRSSALPAAPTNPFVQGGNSFGATATLGTADAFGLNFVTSGSNRLSLAAGSATLTGTGATTLTTDSTLALSSAATAGLTVTSGSTGAITIDSGTTGAVNLGSGANAKTITIGNTTGNTAVNINSGTGNVNFTVDGTGASGKVQIGNSGTATPDLLVLDNGTADPTGVNGGTYYNTGTNKFRCYQNGAWTDCIGGDRKTVVKGTDETVLAGTTLQNDDNLTFSVGSGETWIFQFNLLVSNSNSTTPDWKAAMLGAAGWSCSVVMHGEEPGNAAFPQTASTDCDNAPATLVNATISADAGVPFEVVLQGSITTTSSGSVTLQWTQNTSGSLTGLTVKAGSFAIAQKVGGADLAEAYGSTDPTIGPGDVVVLDPALSNGVQKSVKPYDPTVMGVVSTKPGMVLGDDTLSDIPVLLALSGRVPVKVTTENGAIAAGDSLTSSSLPGVAMKATKDGSIIGMAMTAFDGPGVGSVVVFIKNSVPVFSTTEAASPSQRSLAKTAAAAVTAAFKKSVEFFGKVTFRDEAIFSKRPAFDGDTVGQAVIPAGQSQVQVIFKKSAATAPIVTASLTLSESASSREIPAYAVYDVSAKGFTVKLAEPMTFDVPVSWTALTKTN